MRVTALENILEHMAAYQIASLNIPNVRNGAQIPDVNQHKSLLARFEALRLSGFEHYLVVGFQQNTLTAKLHLESRASPRFKRQAGLVSLMQLVQLKLAQLGCKICCCRHDSQCHDAAEYHGWNQTHQACSQAGFECAQLIG